MIEGAWTVLFNLSGRPSSVVLTIHGNSISGGNTEYFYLGSIKPDGAKFSGSIHGQHYFGSLDPLLNSAPSFDLDMTGSVERGKMIGQAKLRGLGIAVPFEGTRRG